MINTNNFHGPIFIALKLLFINPSIKAYIKNTISDMIYIFDIFFILFPILDLVCSLLSEYHYCPLKKDAVKN